MRDLIKIKLPVFDKDRPVLVLDLHNGKLKHRLSNITRALHEQSEMQLVTAQSSFDCLVKDLKKAIGRIDDSKLGKLSVPEIYNPDFHTDTSSGGVESETTSQPPSPHI